MIDLADNEKRARLLKAISSSQSAMEPFRRVRKELIKDYVGSWYSESGAENKTLVNLINQTARIYTVALAAHNPQVLVSTPRMEMLPFARRFEINLNKLISDMALDVTFRAIVLDAFFCIGCGVVMMRDTDTRFHGLLESEEDVWLDPGEPWFNRVSFDDLILDMPAKELTKMRYCGHRYRADYEKVMDEPGYDKKVKDKLKPTSRQHRDSVGAARDIASDFGSAEDDDLKDMVWLMDVWIAENNSIVTMAVDQDLPPLIEREWIGSQAGPYKFLSLGDTPDNLIPAAPAINLKGMHDLQNRLHRRMEEDSDAHRIVNVYPPGMEDDAERLRTAKRNGWYRGKSPEQIKQFESGGVDQRDMALATFLQSEYDRFAGNLQAMGGLGQQASTLGQEELIHGNVSKNVADMRMAVVSFASDCILDLGRLMWEDQTLELHTSMEVGTTGIQVRSDWLSPLKQNDELVAAGLESQARVGNFEDYEFRVEPYSMVFKTPEQKLQELFQVLREIAPLWPMFQASGATLSAEAIVDEIARLKNRPEFKRFITFANPMDMLGGDENTIRQAPHTTRETIRRNVSAGGTEAARTNALVQSLMGGKPQLNSQQRASMLQGAG
jgi:hypothetical protein